MNPELRALVLCVTILIVAPALFGLGDWLGGTPLAVALPAAAVGATLIYALAGERRDPPPGAPKLPPTGLTPS